MNDLVQEINQLDIGIQVGDIKLSILLYADDIVLMAENENNLQSMLNCVYQWCNKWRLAVNEDKTKIMHFRSSRSPRTEFVFTYGAFELEIVKYYKYLGIILDEFLKFEDAASTLAGAGGRALGAIISKFRTYKNIGFNTFSKMFDTSVSPILEYCSGVWGFKDFKECDKVHHRAARYFLGVHQKAPLLAISGDLGWTNSQNKRYINILRLWNRLLTMDDNRLTKKVFLWDYSLCNQNWSAELLQVLQKIDLECIFHSTSICNLEHATNELLKIMNEDWKDKLLAKPKLRTYIKFKENYSTEDYVKYNISRRQRSLMAQFRIGILPLHVETGRFRGTPLEQRICFMCNDNEIETEQHFLLECNMYQELRTILYDEVCSQNQEFINLDNEDKFKCLITNEWRRVCKYVEKAWSCRQNNLYLKQ